MTTWRSKQDIASHQYRVILASPERVLTGKLFEIIKTPSFAVTVKVLGIDEIHCIVHWGPDFRPEYAPLNNLRAILPFLSNLCALLGVSATLPPRVLQEVRRSLQLTNKATYFVNLGNNRMNLTHSVVPIDNLNDFLPLAQLLTESAELQKSLVFVRTRRNSIWRI